MNEELRERLRRLGIHKGAAHLKPAATQTEQKTSLSHDVQTILGGCEVETPEGPAYVVKEHFERDYWHGGESLSSALTTLGNVLAQLAYDPLWQDLDLSRAAFIDTETTGLAGGTGTLAFLVGVGAFDQVSGRAFHVSQFFLRHPGEEPAMLAALDALLSTCSAAVTFNGRGFDMPLLQARFALNRMCPAILAVPHLDLLLPARRLWRDRLPSCALSSLETHVLGVRRDQADVPGFLIPQMYFDYLTTGNAAEMPRVLYHNTQDILSMVTLAARLGRILADPFADAALDPADLVSLARWYDDLGQHGKAESIFRRALERSLATEAQATAWRRLGLILKRQERYDEAVLAWELLAATETDVVAHVELAKHYEWRARDLAIALKWTRAALEQVETWQPGFARDQARAELLHRQERLERKAVGRGA